MKQAGRLFTGNDRGHDRTDKGRAETQGRMLHIDRDAARGQAAWERVLQRIADGDADILIGTQMLAR
ncbi:MAG: hypothetical protein ACREWE_04710 [Gammaproteobacteria bacterium]